MDGGAGLHFNFGFTDLAPGRYLEAWRPANLIFDPFTLTQAAQIAGTSVGHTLISNGAVTALGANQSTVGFPAPFTTLSPLLELRASGALASASGTVALPAVGAKYHHRGMEAGGRRRPSRNRDRPSANLACCQRCRHWPIATFQTYPVLGFARLQNLTLKP